MKAILPVLTAVASELAELAKSSLPPLQEGELIQREWFSDGVFYRQTVLHDETFVSLFDFRQRKSRREAVGKKVNL